MCGLRIYSRMLLDLITTMENRFTEVAVRCLIYSSGVVLYYLILSLWLRTSNHTSKYDNIALGSLQLHRERSLLAGGTTSRLLFQASQARRSRGILLKRDTKLTQTRGPEVVNRATARRLCLACCKKNVPLKGKKGRTHEALSPIAPRATDKKQQGPLSPD
ncbi:hypothetical protein LY76DRAFT_86999 [Colletotrichum caudatum]|nr:hypothetical protein LY76DRAFT_86999 [Colletotrichum caudatum]